MARKDFTQSGRIAFDDRGNATWEWRTDSGRFKREIDTVRMRMLQESIPLSVSDQALGHNPYSTVDHQEDTRKSRCRSLDDMRKLSETITRARELNYLDSANTAAGSRRSGALEGLREIREIFYDVLECARKLCCAALRRRGSRGA